MFFGKDMRIRTWFSKSYFWKYFPPFYGYLLFLINIGISCFQANDHNFSLKILIFGLRGPIYEKINTCENFRKFFNIYDFLCSLFDISFVIIETYNIHVMWSINLGHFPNNYDGNKYILFQFFVGKYGLWYRILYLLYRARPIAARRYACFILFMNIIRLSFGLCF